MMEIREYLTQSGTSPFAKWFKSLDPNAAARIKGVIERMEEGNFGDAKSVGEGVLERRIHVGPGYRVYFGRDGQRLVILLGGGDKSRQSRHIRAAHDAWADYKQRKRTS